jgi:hypothetical protein
MKAAIQCAGSTPAHAVRGTKVSNSQEAEFAKLGRFPTAAIGFYRGEFGLRAQRTECCVEREYRLFVVRSGAGHPL